MQQKTHVGRGNGLTNHTHRRPCFTLAPHCASKFSNIYRRRGLDPLDRIKQQRWSLQGQAIGESVQLARQTPKKCASASIQVLEICNLLTVTTFFLTDGSRHSTQDPVAARMVRCRWHWLAPVRSGVRREYAPSAQLARTWPPCKQKA